MKAYISWRVHLMRGVHLMGASLSRAYLSKACCCVEACLIERYLRGSDI
jgi:hypothetical protein